MNPEPTTARKTILLTNATSMAGLSAMRTLDAAGFDVIPAALRRFPLGLRSRFGPRPHLLPAHTFEEYAAALLQLVERTRPDVLLPLGTPCVAAVSQQHAAFARLTAINVPTWDAFQSVYDKSNCARLCANLGIPVPRLYSVPEAEVLLRHAAPGVRVVHKPSIDIGAAQAVRYLSTVDDLPLRSAASLPTLLQEFIPGGEDAMRTAVLLFSPTTELLAAFTQQKLRQHPATGGLTIAGISTADLGLVELALPFFRSIRWAGPAEVEYKIDPRDGQPKIIEINPRFPGYLNFAHHCGLPLAALAAQAALPAPVPPRPYPGYRSGQRHVNPQLFLQAVARQLLAGEPMAPVLRRARQEWHGASSPLAALRHDPQALLGRALHVLQTSLTGWPTVPSPPAPAKTPAPAMPR